MAQIRVKRGTRAQLAAAATANGLAAGEPYLITDEKRLAIGTAANAMAEVPRIYIGPTAPDPAAYDLWIQTT